jgi:nucleoside-diphosphate-sugar epimerase
MIYSDILKNKRVLVTGSSGFIGSHLCERLSSSGAEVHGVSRSKGFSEFLSRWWQHDLMDAAAVKGLVSEIRPHFIFHLASHVTGSRDAKEVLPTFRSNFMSTVHLLAASAEVGCERIVLSGSLEEPEPGETPVVPSSPYAAAKFASSAYGRMFHALYRVPVAIARIFMVYGPRQKDLRKLVPYAALSLLRREPPKLGSGLRPVDWIYVEDVADGLISLAVAKDVDGATVDIGSGKLVTIREVVELLSRLVDSGAKPEFGALAERPMEQVRVANAAETEARIGWKAESSLETGLKKTIEWCRTLCG